MSVMDNPAFLSQIDDLYPTDFVAYRKLELLIYKGSRWQNIRNFFNNLLQLLFGKKVLKRQVSIEICSAQRLFGKIRIGEILRYYSSPKTIFRYDPQTV